jgi:hypothetical protein
MQKNNKSLGIGLIVVGVLLLALVAATVVFELANPGFGWKKITLSVVGGVCLVAGVIVSLIKAKK